MHVAKPATSTQRGWCLYKLLRQGACVQVEAGAAQVHQMARGRGTPDMVLTVVGVAEKTLNVYSALYS